ncbi:MAG TPA: glucosaminidase domain-containing protein [Candidatus Mediterraneibacter excrementavium]|nr:glucosaminidase domain-containing protein [Candidatus Mediterraneibacter excrementavium]
MRKSKLLICTLFVSLFVSALPGTESFAAGDTGENAAASGLQDENEQRLEVITAMDKNGNIYEIGASDGSLDETVEVDESGEIIGESPEADQEENGIAVFSLEPEERSADAVLVVNFNTGKGTTTEYSGDGYTSGSYGADAAYLGTDKNGDIRFMLAGVTATVDKDLVELVRYSSVADNVSYYKVSGGKLYHYISQNLKKSPASTINNGPAPSYLSEGVKYYSYDGHYFYDDYNVMSADYRNGSNGASAVNAGNAFYNYFQFLDMNKSTAYSADELNSILNTAMSNAGKDPSVSKLAGTGNSFVTYQNQYSVNALLSLGIAINESGWGTSSIAKNKNNLFGLNAVDTSPGQSANYFASVDDCIREFMDKWMARGYLKDGNWKNYGEFLGNKDSGINVKYASDPYWGEKAAAHAWNLDTIGGSRDYLGLGPAEDTTPSEPEAPPVTETPEEEPETPPVTETPEEEPETPPVTETPEEEPETPPVTETPEEELETPPVTETPEEELETPPATVTRPVTTTPPAATTPATPESPAQDVEKEYKEKTLAVQEAGVSITGSFSENAGLSTVPVEPNTEQYIKYVSADEVKGKVVLGVYDINLNGSMDGKAELSFWLGTEYNGKKVVILHYRDDGKYETFTGTVENGQVSIDVDSFSPFVIALADDGSEGGSTVPTTGVSDDPGSIAVVMIFAAALGMAVFLKRKAFTR